MHMQGSKMRIPGVELGQLGTRGAGGSTYYNIHWRLVPGHKVLQLPGKCRITTASTNKPLQAASSSIKCQ